MRVGFILPHLDPGRGGAERWSFDMAAHLQRRGCDVTHIGISQAPCVASAGVGFLPVKAPDRDLLAFSAAVRSHVDAAQFDVLADMGSSSVGDVILPHGGSRRASFEQNLLLIPAWMRPLKRWIAHRLPRYVALRKLQDDQLRGSKDRLVVALSEMTRRHLIELDGAHPAQLRLVYNGVDVDRFRPASESDRAAARARWNLPESSPVFLIVAHNFALKGVGPLLNALSCASADCPNARLLVVGRKAPGSYLRLVDRLGLAGQVVFTGPLDDPRIAYAAADAYVHPTFYDPCSLTVLEALASGLPTVTSKFNGAGELITPERDGLIVPDPDDVAGLAAAMISLGSTATRQAMSTAARSLAESHSFDANAEQFLIVLREAAALRTSSHRRAA